ncbi:peptidase M23 [Streptomyces sp. NPDC051020]|uniref:peptidase M23 n=1 Tax=Streptomyces sp. NPDC051020 TaxID=3155409 RepID=UPI003428483C
MRIRTIATTAAIAGALTLAGVAPASASGATCNEGWGNGDLCLHYNSNNAGSHTGFVSSVSNQVGYTFKSAGAGQGQALKNNAASVQNWDHSRDAAVYFNSGYSGNYDLALAWTGGNLAATYNNNASHNFW